MNNLIIKNNLKLLWIFIVALMLFFTNEILFSSSQMRNDTVKMKSAVNLAETWFEKIKKMKSDRKINTDAETNIKYACLIGDKFTDITTTLGSLEAKEISTNPEFAALIVKFLDDLKIDSSKRVGLLISGSFPSLSISCLAALQILNIRPVIFSSLGASMFGANQPGATWIDIENYLINNGGLKFRSDLVTLGAEDDNGGGLSEEGIKLLVSTAKNYNVQVYIPSSIRESINRKVDIFLENKIDLLINIGGNQAGLGVCVHSLSIPNTMPGNLDICAHEDRGVIMRLNELGVPFINLLNIKSLAINNNISINPSIKSSELIYNEKKYDKIIAAFSIIIISGLIFFVRK